MKMSVERKKAIALVAALEGQKYGRGTIRKVKLGRCMREYWTAEITVDDDDPDNGTVTLKCAYNYAGHYVGEAKMAYRLCARRGIMPELISPKHSICSIGRSSKDGKWYGWSHRAIHGFRKGATIRAGDCAAADPEFPEAAGLPVGFRAKTEKDKRAMAVAFARGVG